MKTVFSLILALVAWRLASDEPAREINQQSITVAIRTVLDQQVTDWNDGHIEKFMRGYAQSATTRFAAGGNVSQGWQTVLDRYRKAYADKAAMGKLTFSDLDITVAAPDAALVFGRWRLEREQGERSGLFTLFFRKTSDGWRIVHDHTSFAGE